MLAHQKTFLLVISTTFGVGAVICIPAKVPVLLADKKEGLLMFQTKKCFGLTIVTGFNPE